MEINWDNIKENGLDLSEDIRKNINDILMSNNIEDNMEFILKVIPEIKYSIGFEHRHPHHHLDVWEHTLEAMNNLEDADLETKMAMLLHDIGKPFSYQDDEVRHFHGHPEVSAQMTEKILERLGYDEKFIEDVCYLIRTHDTIIEPNNLDNTYNMIKKRLQVQYADAKAHKPEKVEKRIKLLNDIKSQLQKLYEKKEIDPR